MKKTKMEKYAKEFLSQYKIVDIHIYNSLVDLLQDVYKKGRKDQYAEDESNLKKIR